MKTLCDNCKHACWIANATWNVLTGEVNMNPTCVCSITHTVANNVTECAAYDEVRP